MDQAIRNKLRSVVTQCRRLLEESVAQQLQGRYDIYATGKKDEVRAEKDVPLGHLSDEEREARRDILAHFEHILALGYKAKEALEQLIREIAFTHLNRLCAYKMMEVRDVYVGGQRFREAVSKGLKSQGFLFYLADHPEDERRYNAGQQEEAYRHFLNWLGGTLSQEIGVLFSPTDPANRVYPPQRVLEEVLDLLNSEELKGIWSEDETIGWVYQYFTPKELRDQARKESQAPRNSYELAFRNQFFTPRYVVEFLTDNTLGRIWYEMRRGNTRLKDECRHMVRRPTEVFLRWDCGDLDDKPPFWDAVTRGDFGALPETATWDEINPFALLINGYEEAECHGLGDCGEFANARLEAYRETGQWKGNALELWCCLFFEQRRWRHYGYEPQGEDFEAILALYQALRRALTATTDGLGQDELLKRPIFNPIRPMRDPREIKILNPACGSGHFLLYCFALLLVIYEEAWEQGTIDRAEFGLRPDPAVLPETVRLDPEVSPRSNYSGEMLVPDRAYVVVTDLADGGDGVASHEPYIIDEDTRFRVPFRHRVPLKQFDYAQALREGWFTPEVGQRFIGQSGCFRFEGIPVRTEDEAYRAFRQQVPGLILRHNLHGIDIDLRCTQIAALALWLRCQRAYQEMGLKNDRPPVLKANVVCAEPMPGEERLLNEFLKTLREDRLEALIRQVLNVPEDRRVRATEGMVESLSDLVRTVWDKMRLAGEVGSLFKIEDELQDAIRQGQEQWEERLPLFRFTEYGLSEEPKERLVRFVPGDVEGELITFWDKAETLVRRALDEFVTFASNGGRFQRQLFVEDAEQGLGFVDVCRRHYDIVLMNPPFGEVSLTARQYLYSILPETARDLFAGFVSRFLLLLREDGCLGAITNRTAFFSEHLDKWRMRAFGAEVAILSCMADLGYGVLDAVVETAAYVCFRSGEGRTTFIDLLHSTDKEASLKQGVSGITAGREGRGVTFRAIRSFQKVPGFRIAYQVHPYWVERFNQLETHPIYSSKYGLVTGDDFRYLRCFWEVPEGESTSGRWRWLAKGGDFSRYRTTVHLMADWDGRERMRRLQNSELYGRIGATYTERTTSNLSARALQRDCLFSGAGPGVIPHNGADASFVLAYLNSAVAALCLETIIGGGDFSMKGTAARHLEPRYLQFLPNVRLTAKQRDWFDATVTQLIGNLDFVFNTETDPFYVGPTTSGNSPLHDLAIEHYRSVFASLGKCYPIVRSLEAKVIELVGVPARRLTDLRGNMGYPLPECTDLRRLPNDWEGTVDLPELGDPSEATEKSEKQFRFENKLSHYLHPAIELFAHRYDVAPDSICAHLAETGRPSAPLVEDLAASLISHIVGITFGRWAECPSQCRSGDGERASYLDPIPLIQPARKGARTGSSLPLYCDDEQHSDDILRHIEFRIEKMWPSCHEELLNEMRTALGVTNLREYLRKPGKGGFWDDHIARYTKSRRKAPIYWLLQSSKKNYALWIYYHRLDKDILFKALLNYVEPKIRKEDTRLGELRSQKAALGPGDKRSKKLDKDIDRQEAFLSELRDFEDKLRRAANLHLDPDLNDGVVLNIAPLRELVPWKEAKSYWDDLMDGQYEWSSIAKQLREKGLVSSPAT